MSTKSLRLVCWRQKFDAPSLWCREGDFYTNDEQSAGRVAIIHSQIRVLHC